MPERCESREEIRWRPNKVVDGDLLMYLRAARSIAAFAGMCGGTAEDRCEAEAMDETTVNALDTLHKHNYDTSKSMQALVKGPSVMYIERKWSEDDMKRFAKGVRNLGKNFFKIRKEHLPHKDTSELVEFYYFWKKSPAANNSRPNYRCRHRRQLKRQSPRTSQPDNCEASSGSESGGEESEESDGSRDVTTICQVCYTNTSRDWHNTGKDGGVVCSKCHTVYKKYGEDSSSSGTTAANNNNLESPSPVTNSLSPYHFRPVPQDEDSAPPSKHNMRTRRSNNSASSNGKKNKERASSPDADASSNISSSNSGVNRSDRNNTNDKENDDKKSKDSTSKSKKRRFDTEEESSGKKKKDRSDSESGSESGSVSGPEGLGNDRESDTNNQEELSDSSRPSSPTSSIEPVRPRPTPSSTSQDTTGTTPSVVGATTSNSSVTPSNISSVLPKDNSIIPLAGTGLHIEGSATGRNSPSSKHLSSQQGLPISVGGGNNPLQQQQQTNPFANPAVSSGALGLAPGAPPPPPQLTGIQAPLSSSTTPSSPSSSSNNTLAPGIPSSSSHLRSLQQQQHHHPQNPNQFIRPPIGAVGGATGHISGIGTITNASGSVQHPIGSISANNTSVACNFSPLVIPSPALSRASSTGTFIPRTELAVPSLSNSTPASSGTDSIANSSAKTSSLVSSTDSSARIPSNSNNNNSSNTSNPSGINSAHSTASSNNPFSRMQQQQEQQSSSTPNEDQQDKKPPVPPPSSSLPPHPAGLPPHMPPAAFLPGAHPGAVPFSPFHPYYYSQHPGAAHIPPHHLAALHPAAAAAAVAAAAAAGVPPPSSLAPSSGPNPLSTAPPPVPSLVPIKKEVHSPPPPLKSSSEIKSQSDLHSSSATSSPSASALHALHRSLPLPPDGAMHKLPPGFPQSGLPSTAPLPPPPLTVIDHRDNKPPVEDLSKSVNDHYSKDHSTGGIRGMNPSPHRQEGGLPPPPSASLLHQSRMDNNLSILSESREIGLKSGINPSSSHPSSSSSSHPHIKEEPNQPPHHSLPPSAAAFQPYPHHHHHPHLSSNPHHPGLPPSSSSSSSQLPPQPHGSSTAPPQPPSSSSSSSSVLQVPHPPHLAGDHHHSHHHGGMPSSHHMDTSHHSSSGGSGRSSELISSIKKEPGAPVEEIQVESDDDEPIGGSTTPGPPPTICNREFYKSNSAIFVKVFDRGERNQCSRTDFIFKPLSGSNLAKKREERIRKASHSSSSSSAREEKKRVETPPRATSASEGQKSVSNSGNNPSTSSGGGHPGHGPPTPYQDRHTPRQFTDTPALRQLHEYARPHVLNADPRGPYALAGLQHHPHETLMTYRIGMFPPGSRERLELELERDKRERDAREREMRERELREMELRDKMELKPGMYALERLLPHGAGQLTDAASWLDLQRRMGFPPTAGGPLVPPPGHSPSAVGSHVPGVYPPSSLASDLFAREREKLDRFGLAANLPQLAADMSYASAVERLSQERQAAERQAQMERERDRDRLAALANDPGARLQLATAAAATQHAHTHTHAHSHTHLHLHQQEVAAHAQAVAQAQAHGLTPPAFPLSLAAGGHGPLYPPHHPLAGGGPGSEQLGGGAGPSGSSSMPPTSSANSLPVLPPGVMHHPLLAGISNREELLQREIYSRSGHFIDPALAHQLSAQAAAHEALQRQIAMERERFGSSGHLPH